MLFNCFLCFTLFVVTHNFILYFLPDISLNFYGLGKLQKYAVQNIHIITISQYNKMLNSISVHHQNTVTSILQPSYLPCTMSVMFRTVPSLFSRLHCMSTTELLSTAQSTTGSIITFLSIGATNTGTSVVKEIYDKQI